MKKEINSKHHCNSILILNIPNSISEEEIEQNFQIFEEIQQSIFLPQLKDEKRKALITFKSELSVDNALKGGERIQLLDSIVKVQVLNEAEVRKLIQSGSGSSNSIEKIIDSNKQSKKFNTIDGFFNKIESPYKKKMYKDSDQESEYVDNPAKLRIKKIRRNQSKRHFIPSWIRDDEFYSYQYDTKIFRLVAPGQAGIYCNLCSKYQRATGGEYITQPAYPIRIDGLRVHRDSTIHSASIVKEKERLDSMITKDNQKVDIKRKNAATKMVKIVHWTAIQEFSQRKIPDLIRLIDRISENKQLSEFGHFSSFSLYGFMKIIGEYYINRESKRISDAGIWAAMLDDSKDVSDIEQLVIVVRYLDDNLNIQTNFINISDLGPDGTKANNLIKKFSSICKNLNLKLNNLISITSNGASSFTGVQNGMVAQLQVKFPQILPIKCYNHRLQSALKDSIEDANNNVLLEVITTVVQLCSYYHNSPKRLQDLKQSCTSLGMKMLKLQRPTITRWSSHFKAVNSTLHNLPAILNHLTRQPAKDSIAKSFLAKITLKSFPLRLFTLKIILSEIHHTASYFQKNGLLFGEKQPNIQALMDILLLMANGNQISIEVGSNWELFEEKWGQFNEDDDLQIIEWSEPYISSLINNLTNRFPKEEILSAFNIFNPIKIPTDPNLRI
ncbi:MAG: putative Zinc finger protein 862 [Streblomastix strix]|uniref:Putative Zinc finger protein 862 n=1 Tax=Streblomastix strix TaxID=222440 RepID=A0A5J4VGD3_9EUKA|nr:MAG: putative Zinc finger protein 862 [Streblomastix strix]